MLPSFKKATSSSILSSSYIWWVVIIIETSPSKLSIIISSISSLAKGSTPDKGSSNINSFAFLLKVSASANFS
ncbi:hypothetical protein D3C73_1392500 [compost metagenome]